MEYDNNTLFEDRFASIYPKFVRYLLKRTPNLSPKEVKISMLIKMNYKNSDVLQIAGVSKSTLDNMRHNIRKKMKLKRNENLVLEILKL